MSESVQRFRVWQSALMILLGPIGVGLVGGTVAAVIVAAIDLSLRGSDFSVESVMAATQGFPAIATSLLVTAIGFAGGPAALAMLTKRPVAETLGLSRSPDPIVLIAAPIGTLALGPTSDTIVRHAEELIPGFTFGALGQIAELVERHSALALLPFLALCPGFGEEILFRGFVQRQVGRGALAIIVSAFSFSAIHLDPHHVLGVIPLGFYLAWVASRADSTWPTIVAHTANNAMAVVAAKFFSDANGTEEPASLTVLFGGWGVCALSMVVIARASRAASKRA